MGIFSFLKKQKNKTASRESKNINSKRIKANSNNSPFAIKFDSSVVTDTVKAVIRENIELLEEIKPKDNDQIYEEALRAIMVGGDCKTLSISLANICGLTKQRAGQISTHLASNANAAITRERQQSLGITEA